MQISTLDHKAIPKVFIVILNWNGIKDTIDCLKSISILTYTNIEVLVIDNASRDGSVAVIRSVYPMYKIIINKINLGFTGGNNLGIEYALEHGADYVWLLNNDTVVERDSLSELIMTAESSDTIGLVSPLVYYLEDKCRVQFVGSYINWNNISILYPDKLEKVPIEFQSGENVCLWGTALLIKRRVIEAIGNLKHEYFAYWEDTEYSMRAIIAGFENVVCTKSKIYHNNVLPEKMSVTKGPHYYYYMNRNRYFLGKEYRKYAKNYFLFIRRYIASLLRDLGECRDLNANAHFDACLIGVWHGLRGISGQMSNTPNMPKLFRIVFSFLAKCYPYILADLLDGHYIRMCKLISNKVRGYKVE